MSEVIVSIWAQTDVGMQRPGNEDSFLVADLTAGSSGLSESTATHKVGERGSLLVVSDGMGGAAAGEIASEMAVTTLRELLQEDSVNDDISQRLQRATEAANDRIWHHAQDNPELSGMGATVTAVLVQEGAACIAQVGDSRAYLVRGEQIKQLTKDQSLAQMLLDFGAIQPEQLHAVPQNVIMQALGTQPDVKVAMSAVSLTKDDCLLICSDGLSNKVQPEEMKRAIADSPNLNDACQSLIDTANQRGGEDNITVVVARFAGDALEPPATAGSITSSLRQIGPDFFAEKLMEMAAQSNEHIDEAAQAQTDDDPEEEITQRLDKRDVDDKHADDGQQSDGSSKELFATVLVDDAPEPTSGEARLPRKSFALVWIVALISLLLIGATAYFFYNLYLKPKQAPLNPDHDAGHDVAYLRSAFSR
ncbi:MAG TPA: Stp1/IreP family PP2C-type Ser/Thr phosphatase [Blastocatellia bacterium]|nr:Stp1/IreP family PP2C-type Ser/Thr phosphatase [Blastocatellia bacterium]